VSVAEIEGMLARRDCLVINVTRCVLCSLLVMALACLLGCSSPDEPEGSGSPVRNDRVGPGEKSVEPVEVTVFAAASLTDILDAFHADLAAEQPELQPRANLAGTQELVIQAQQGAQFDVFLSASEHHMDTLVADGLVREPVPFCHNGICVAVDPASTEVRELADLASEGTSVAVATETCPVGRYTRQVWSLMAESPDFGPEYAEAIRANVVSEETNVKLVLSKVALGEVDAGFVYVTDVVGQELEVLRLPDTVQVPSTYVAAVSSETPRSQAAEEYLAALTGPMGAKHMEEARFRLP
jgi:molybdate transport system substrate-binding protein